MAARPDLHPGSDRFYRSYASDGSTTRDLLRWMLECRLPEAG